MAVNRRKRRGLTAAVDTDVNGARNGRKRLARNRCQNCGEVHGKRLGAKFCSGRCKSAAWRKAHRKDLREPAPALARVCANPRCGVSFWAFSASALYCCDSCRVIAHRLKLAATVDALPYVLQCSPDTARDLVDSQGAKVCRKLEAFGYVFDRAAFVWTRPL